MFGSAVFTSGGFALNDAMLAFSSPQLLRRYHPASRGPNRPTAGSRPVSSMTPTIVQQQGKVHMLLGASGGASAPTALSQVLLAQIVFGLTPKQAVNDPRIHTPPEGGLRLEPSAPKALRENLIRRGQHVLDHVPMYSAVGVIRIDPRNPRRIDAVADPRKGGAALTRE
jgi:gamma-glutamyltranspeptidase/glutathione hydrolase